MRNSRTSHRISFLAGVMFGFIIICLVSLTSYSISAKESFDDKLQIPVNFNGHEIELDYSIEQDGRTYIQLRELCEKINVNVKWQDPNFHMLPTPGGNLPAGINLTNPTYVYIDEVTNYDNIDEVLQCIDITGIYNEFRDKDMYEYYFNDEGLVLKLQKKTIPLRYNPCNGRMYMEIEEYREKIHPYLIEICSQ